MKKLGKEEIKLLNIQIGCILRHARLKKDLSQHDLSLLLDTNPTMIGRVERFENISGWDKILSISQELEINFCELFVIKEKKELLLMIEESFKLEERLTQDKRDYYRFLRKTIENSYNNLPSVYNLEGHI